MDEAIRSQVYTTTLLSGPFCGILGVSWTAVLEQCGIAVGNGNPGPSFVNAEKYCAFWNAMVELSNQSSIARLLGLRLASGPAIPCLFTFTTAPNLKTGAHRMAKFKNLFGPAHFKFRETKEEFSLEIQPSATCAALPVSFSSTKIIYLQKQSESLSVKPFRPTRVSLPLPEHERAELKDVFGMVPNYGPPKITFSTNDSMVPFISHNPDLWNATEIDLIKQASVQAESTPFLDRVRVILLEGMSVSDTTAEFVARRMQISRTTLLRRLKEEGHSFQSLLDETRKEHSMRYLAKSTFTNQQIAYFLGYGDYSSFYRSFK